MMKKYLKILPLFANIKSFDYYLNTYKIEGLAST